MFRIPSSRLPFFLRSPTPFPQGFWFNEIVKRAKFPVPLESPLPIGGHWYKKSLNPVSTWPVHSLSSSIGSYPEHWSSTGIDESKFIGNWPIGVEDVDDIIEMKRDIKNIKEMKKEVERDLHYRTRDRFDAFGQFDDQYDVTERFGDRYAYDEVVDEKFDFDETYDKLKYWRMMDKSVSSTIGNSGYPFLTTATYIPKLFTMSVLKDIMMKDGLRQFPSSILPLLSKWNWTEKDSEFFNVSFKLLKDKLRPIVYSLIGGPHEICETIVHKFCCHYVSIIIGQKWKEEIMTSMMNKRLMSSSLITSEITDPILIKDVPIDPITTRRIVENLKEFETKWKVFLNKKIISDKIMRGTEEMDWTTISLRNLIDREYESIFEEDSSFPFGKFVSKPWW